MLCAKVFDQYASLVRFSPRNHIDSVDNLIVQKALKNCLNRVLVALDALYIFAFLPSGVVSRDTLNERKIQLAHHVTYRWL